MDLISWGHDTRDSIANFWGVNARQGDYYANAGCYLGFVEKFNSHWKLTHKGKQFVDMPTTRRNQLLFESILINPVFNEVAEYYLENHELLEEGFICDSLQKHTDIKFSESTLKRRVRTVRSWFLYMIKTLDELNQASI